ncbi:MAG: hypothetical protein J4G06_09390 [Caldilineaceae bacterium]|nr:hypothetical protein [Caldilineaceae bacterium]
MDRLTLSSGHDNRRQVLEVDLDRTRMADIYDWCMGAIPDHGEVRYRLPQDAPASVLTLSRRGPAMDLLLTGRAEGAEPPFQYAGCIGPSHFRLPPGTFEQPSLLDGLDFRFAPSLYPPENKAEENSVVPMREAPRMTFREYLNAVTRQPLLPFQANSGSG